MLTQFYFYYISKYLSLHYVISFKNKTVRLPKYFLYNEDIKYTAAKLSNPIINLNGPYSRMVQNNQLCRKIRALNEVNGRLRGDP